MAEDPSPLAGEVAAPAAALPHLPHEGGGTNTDPAAQPPNRVQWCSAPNPVAVAGVPGTSDWNRWAAP